jgi:hypothetical protein
MVARWGPLNDLPALAWLCTTVALCVAARRRPALLGPALVSAGLAVGTKTTTLPLALAALGIAAYAIGPGRLRPLRKPLGLAFGLALACGGIWYLRNLAAHGSPVWPFSKGPLGDDQPRFIVDQGHSFLERPRATLRGGYDRAYLYFIAGGYVLGPGAVVAAALARRRWVTLTAALGIASVLLWTAAPFTGVADDPALRDAVLSTTRYLLPALAALAAAIALLTVEPGWHRRLGVTLLSGALVADIAGLHRLDVPFPAGRVLVAGAVLALVAVAARRPVAALVANPLAPAVVALAVAAALGLRAGGITERHADAYESDRGLVTWFTGQPAFRDGSQAIWGSPTAPGSLVGDHLRHRVTLIPTGARCAEVRGIARTGWIVVSVSSDPRLARQVWRVVRCLRGVPLLYRDSTAAVFGSPKGVRAST